MRAIAGIVVLGVATLLVNCDSQREDVAHLGKRTQRQQHSIDVHLPVEGDIDDYAMVANGTLRLGDRSGVINPQNGNANIPLFNLGPTSTEIGVDVDTAELTSGASVFLRNYATVQGDLTTNGTLTTQFGANVTGTVATSAPAFHTQTLTLTQATQPDPQDPRDIWSGQSLTLTPGGYGRINVSSGGTLYLQPGTYAFSELVLESAGTIDFAPDPNVPTIVFLDEVAAFRGSLTSNAPPTDTARSILLVHKGSNTMRLENTPGFAVVAPNATIELAPHDTTFHGSVFAQGVHLEPGLMLSYVPYEFWDWVLPPQPIVSCVMPSGRGRFVAAFGYENPRARTLTIPAGAENRFDPDPGPPHVPPSTFEPGEHERVTWVPMPATGVTWHVHGKSTTATTNSPGCDVVGLEPTSDEPLTEGRTLPRPGIPPVPAPHKWRVAVENASGQGRFAAPRPIPAQLPPGTGVSDPEVSPPDLAAELGKAPSILPGYHEEANLPLTLKIKTSLHNDTGFEGENLSASSFMDTDYQQDSDLSINSDLEAYWTHTIMAPIRQAVPIEFYQVERDDFQPSEAVKASLTYWPSGEVTGTIESGRITKPFVPGLPFPLGDYEKLGESSVDLVLGETMSFDFYRDNNVEFSVSGPAQASGNATRVCANWTAYFADEGVPAPDGVFETFQGIPLEGGLRVRGYPAAYAEYQLWVKGAYASMLQSGHLDEDGCTPEISSNAFVYDEAVQDGSEGGLSLFLLLRTNLVKETTTGEVAFPITSLNIVGNEQASVQIFQATTFDDDWPLVGGYRRPPSQIALTSPFRTHGTTVAANVSHVMRRAEDLGITIPDGEFPVLLDRGINAGTINFQGCPVDDSVAGSGQVEIGEAYFPECETTSSGTCDSPAPDCRTPCSTDDMCKGGQHCARADDPADGCDGGTCFCAYASQGTFKYVATHELGHMFQRLFTGGRLPLNPYTFDCPKQLGSSKCVENLGRRTRSEILLVDPPLMDEACGCQHVSVANAQHCLQSIEDSSRSDGEGFAHFFASLIWNDPNASTCRFNYYKEFLDVGTDCRVDGDPSACQSFVLRSGEVGTVTFPPIPVDCGAPAKWRNQMRCMVDNQSQSELSKTYMGTEYDWMTFLYATNKQTGFNNLMSIYNHACHPEHPGESASQDEVLCGDSTTTGEGPEPIAWVDMELTEKNPDGTVKVDPVTGAPIVVAEYGGFLSGAERKWGANSQEADDISTAGFEHGVSEDISPLVP